MLALASTDIDKQAKSLAETVKTLATTEPGMYDDEMKASVIADAVGTMAAVENYTKDDQRAIIAATTKFGITQKIADLAQAKLGKTNVSPWRWYSPWWVKALIAVGVIGTVGSTVYFVRRRR